MEPSYQTRKLIGKLLLVLLLAGVGGAFWAHFHSPLVQTLTARAEGPVQVAVLTQPAMHFSYNPATRKAVITLGPCDPGQKETCFNGRYDRYYVPQQTQQTEFWSSFKHHLTAWRFNPAPVFTYLQAYVNALVQRRTNIRPSEFVLMSLELPFLNATDFAVEQPAPAKKQKNRRALPKEEPLSKPQLELPSAHLSTKPLVVEILNASGKKGLAGELKQYLREQNAKGLLQVDVIDTGNYPSLQDTSFMIDYSGKLVQVTQISRAIGITGEIRRETSATAICDSRIVLGKDFKMPL